MNWYSWCWYIWNCCAVLPFFYFTYKRAKNQLNWDDYEKKELPTYTQDNVFRYSMIASPSYYILDSITLLYLYDQFDVCQLAFLLHHIITLYACLSMLTLPYYPWFVSGPIAMHCLLIIFPQHKWLDYGYLFFILHMIYGLNIKPWCLYKKYSTLVKCVYCLLCVPIIMLWWWQCPNDMQNTNK